MPARTRASLPKPASTSIPSARAGSSTAAVDVDVPAAGGTATAAAVTQALPLRLPDDHADLSHLTGVVGAAQPPPTAWQLKDLNEKVHCLRARIPHHPTHAQNGGVFVCWNAGTIMRQGEVVDLPHDVTLRAQLDTPVCRRTAAHGVYLAVHIARLCTCEWLSERVSNNSY